MKLKLERLYLKPDYTIGKLYIDGKYFCDTLEDQVRDLAKERKRFTRENLQGEGGVLLFPNTYTDIQQVKSTPFVIDADQMNAIKENVYNYFGVNAEGLQNKAYGDSWSAFYEGAIEPFAIQFSDVATKMFFTERERASGSFFMAT